jgi:tetraprenyl-beta-curcumene synthase
MALQRSARFGPPGVFARAAGRYWLSVFPGLRCELRRWQARAREIEDPVLRRLALEAQHDKRRSLEGAVAFAAFVPRAVQRPVITALTAYQVIFDYLDTVAEQPNRDPIRNGRQLNQALLAALEPQPTCLDYYAHNKHRCDSGYLEVLIQTCRDALAVLPSYATILVPARRAAKRIVVYQSLNHGDASGSHDAFAAWARKETEARTGLRWWETGAAAGSSLSVLALIGATADPDLTQQDSDALDAAYYPWISGLHTLLDSLIDRPEDHAGTGQRSLIDYYASPAEVATRLEMITIQAVRHARVLPNAYNHAMILAAMVSFYLSDPQASTPDAQPAKTRVLSAVGGLSVPTMFVMHARQAAGALRLDR